MPLILVIHHQNTFLCNAPSHRINNTPSPNNNSLMSSIYLITLLYSHYSISVILVLPSSLYPLINYLSPLTSSSLPPPNSSLYSYHDIPNHMNHLPITSITRNHPLSLTLYSTLLINFFIILYIIIHNLYHIYNFYREWS